MMMTFVLLMLVWHQNPDNFLILWQTWQVSTLRGRVRYLLAQSDLILYIDQDFTIWRQHYYDLSKVSKSHVLSVAPAHNSFNHAFPFPMVNYNQKSDILKICRLLDFCMCKQMRSFDICRLTAYQQLINSTSGQQGFVLEITNLPQYLLRTVCNILIFLTLIPSLPIEPGVPVGPIFPWFPMGPVGPGGPGKPGSPAGPASPLDPALPCIPSFPATPGSPLSPCGPAGPGRPCIIILLTFLYPDNHIYKSWKE